MVIVAASFIVNQNSCRQLKRVYVLGMENAPDRRLDSLLRIAEVKRRTGLSTATIYRRVDAGTFPRKVQLGGKCVAWYESDIGSFVSDPAGYRA